MSELNEADLKNNHRRIAEAVSTLADCLAEIELGYTLQSTRNAMKYWLFDRHNTSLAPDLTPEFAAIKARQEAIGRRSWEIGKHFLLDANILMDLAHNRALGLTDSKPPF